MGDLGIVVANDEVLTTIIYHLMRGRYRRGVCGRGKTLCCSMGTAAAPQRGDLPWKGRFRGWNSLLCGGFCIVVVYKGIRGGRGF